MRTNSKQMKGITIPTTVLESVANGDMSKEEAGEILTIIAKYAIFKEEPEMCTLNYGMKILWRTLKNELDFNIEKYLKKKEVAISNGRLGGRPKTPDYLKKYATENTLKATKSEIKFKKILDKWGVKYEFQYPISVKYKNNVYDYILDFKVDNLIIEIDGGYHNDDIQKKKDEERDMILKSKGYRIMRIPNKGVDTLEEEANRKRINSLDEIISA